MKTLAERLPYDEILDFEDMLYKNQCTEKGRSIEAYSTVFDFIKMAKIINDIPTKKRRLLMEYYESVGYLSPNLSLLSKLLNPKRFPRRKYERRIENNERVYIGNST